MGRKDTVTKDYMSNPIYFADAFNSSVFQGRQIVKADSLSAQEMDPTEIGLVITDDAKDIVQKVRDVLKKSVIMNDGKMTYLMLGIENQSEVHYAMPVKNLIYDALNYGQQVKKIVKEHRKEKDIKGAEFLSGFSKADRIMPVLTLTIYFGSGVWDAPRSLKDMFPDDIDEEMLSNVDDYRLHLIIPAEITDFSLFRTDLGKAMRFIAASDSPAKIKELSKDIAFVMVGADTVHLINECTGSNIEVPEGERVVNMCKGMEGFGEMKREEGVLDTLRDLVHKGLLAVKDAAEQAGMSTEEFQQKMQER